MTTRYTNKPPMLKNSGVMCLIHVNDPNREDGIRAIDLGNYFVGGDGKRCLVLSKEDAKSYAHLVDVPVYVRKESQEEAIDDRK